jgi:hypothetical protein
MVCLQDSHNETAHALKHAGPGTVASLRFDELLPTW